MNRVITRAVLAAVFAAATAPSAFAQLNRVGPVGPLGYPTFYQDKTGLALEFCDNQTQAELEGGWCVLLPPDLPLGTAPESRTGTVPNFADEHFYYVMNAGGAGVAIPGQPGQTTRVLLVAAIEGAFGGGPVKAGDEMVFARLRIRIDSLPYSGTYTVYTPFGKRVFEDQVAGDRLFVTEDIGITVGNFQEALNGSIFPFVVPSLTPGGAELPPVSASNPVPDAAHFDGGGATPYPGNGRRYIADPARLGPVTGSVADFSRDGIPNPNLFRIDIESDDILGGHATLIETFDFSLAGRIYEGAIPGSVTLDRASYARGSASGEKLDLYATATPVTVGRVPGTPPAAAIPSNLVYYNAACVPTLDANNNPGAPYSRPGGATVVQLLNHDKTYFAQHNVLPAGLTGCLEANASTANGQSTTVYTLVSLTDQVTISQADFDPATQTLTVKAASSDATVVTQADNTTKPQQTLTVTGFGNLVDGQLIVHEVLAAPATITVTSSGGGSATRQVSSTFPAAAGGETTGGGTTGGNGGGTTPPPPVTPIANNVEAATFEEEAVEFALTANAGETVTLVTTGALGTAAVTGSGTVIYTPNLNVSGTDSFAYTVTANGLTSNTATVTISIAPVNDAPTAVAETVNALVGRQAKINLMSNDIDPDGSADLVRIFVDGADPKLGPVTTSGGVATFTPTGAGNNLFLTYRVQDQAGVTSSVTSRVNVFAAETIALTRWQYTVNQNRWVVTGTVSPIMGQTMTIAYASGAFLVNGSCTGNAAGTVIGTAVTDNTGTWTLDRGGIDPNSVLNPTNQGRRSNFWCGGTPTLRITSSASNANATTGAVQVK